MDERRTDRGTMDEAPGTVPPADRQWGFCRRITPELERLLERKQLAIVGADHVVVLTLDRWSVLLAYWAGERVLGYLIAPPSVGRDIARLGAPESV
jgi:hypothetical protein